MWIPVDNLISEELLPDFVDIARAHGDAEIPRGQVTTYGELAGKLSAQLGRPISARAVGGAVGRNPISILIPCHRVVGADGSLTGYAGGVERKARLLRLEGAKA